MGQANNPNVDKKGDFILRWKLDLPAKKKQSKEPFRDFVKDLFKELLDIAMPAYKGEDVKIDGFHFLNEVKITSLYKHRKTG